MKLLFSFIKKKSDKMGKIELANLNRVTACWSKSNIVSNRICRRYFWLVHAAMEYEFCVQMLAQPRGTLMLALVGQRSPSPAAAP